MNRKTDIDQKRRTFLKNGFMGAAIAASPVTQALEAFARGQGRSGTVNSQLGHSPYGPIRPVADDATGLDLLQLPDGFSYQTFSWTADLMANGRRVPGVHDGMGVIGTENDGQQIILVRNHELGTGEAIEAPGFYDPAVLEDGQRPAGGNTNIYFRRDGGSIRTVPSLGGTRTNCAGGTTPWGTWLSCEENTADYTDVGGRTHGYVFEVTAYPNDTSGRPITGMGRYKHEAAAVDPGNSFVYLTEDNRNRSPIYRFIPDDRSQQTGSLERGGRLQAAKVRGVHHAELFDPQLGDSHELEWVDISDPDRAPNEDGDSGPYLQAREAGALSISRGEGIWYHQGMMYVVDTSAGRNSEGIVGRGEGAVWMLDTTANRMRCVFASPDAVVGNNPDNITISPRGGILMCEDGGGVSDQFGFGERLMGLQTNGESFIFAKNNVTLDAEQIARAGKLCEPGDYRNSEIAGACFEPEGEILFFNIQIPGITVAVRGPWLKGPL